MSPGTLTLVESVISNNTVTVNAIDTFSIGVAEGGGASSSGAMTMTRCTVNGNTVSASAPLGAFANGGGLVQNGAAQAGL